MRRRLRASLTHIFEQTEGHIPFSRPKIRAFLARVGASPVQPLTFAIYNDLVLAIDRDDLKAAEALIAELAGLAKPDHETEITELPDVSSTADGARYNRSINTDPTILFAIRAPEARAAKSCRARIAQAFAMLDGSCPELAAETRVFLRQIVLASGGTGAGKGPTFSGASSPMIWGAIIINADNFLGSPGDVIDMAQLLVHESAHNLLFGISVDGALLKNSPDERYTSPLRADPRPLTGIYHATFVLARMYFLMHGLLKSGTLSAANRPRAQKRLARNKGLFEDGYSTLLRHAKFTGLSRTVLENARKFVQDVS